MKNVLLITLLIACSTAGFSQGVKQDKLFALSEVRSSDDYEYEQYTYNEDMLLQATETLTVDGTKLIDSLWYDEFNNITKLDIHQRINNVWTYVSYIEYTYDANGNRLTRSNYNSFGTPNFTLGGVFNYFYNEENKLTNWELYMGGTDLMQICTLSYNDDGQVVLEIGQDAFYSGTMENSWKTEYLYNADGTLQSTEQSYWMGSYWEGSSADLFYYDNAMNCTKWEHIYGNTVADRKEYEYNMEHTIDQLVTPVTPEYDTENLVARNNMVTTQHWYSQNDVGNLVYVCDYLYNYDTLTYTGIPSYAFHADNLRIYPNPASDLITIAAKNTIINNIDVVDNAGKVVLKKSHLNMKEVNLNLTPLKSGVYHVRLTTSRGILTEKLIVQ
jgi:hypothetical protein